jgi:hypothetical protein
MEPIPQTHLPDCQVEPWAAAAIGRNIVLAMGSTLLRVATLTLALGVTVVVSWVAIRGLSVFNGPGLFLDPSWLVVWAVQAGLAGLVGFAIGRWWRDGASLVRLAILVLAAWVGELLVVSLLAPFLPGTLSILHGPALWLVATGGPIQPIAAVVGALIGAASVRSESATQPG